jgi:hypothetical protein
MSRYGNHSMLSLYLDPVSVCMILTFIQAILLRQ